MICSYCQTENQQNVAFCSFCNAPIVVTRPKQKDFLAADHAEKPFEELIQFHTYDLLVLLRLVREERSTAYKLMRMVQKAPEGIRIDSDTLSFAEGDYKRWTGRMKVIEGILIDRMGYKPNRVDNKLLDALQAKIIRSKDSHKG